MLRRLYPTLPMPFGLLVLVAACGNRPEPAAPPTPSASSEPAASAAPVPEASTAPVATEPKRRKPFEIYNGCSDVVTVVFGEDPTAPNAGRRTIAPNSAIDGPRDPEGNQALALLNGAGDAIAKVHVTKNMKRVEVGRSCRTLDAR